MDKNLVKRIGSMTLLGAMLLTGCSKAASDINREDISDWRDTARHDGTRGDSDLADHVSSINWDFSDADKGDGYYTNVSFIDVSVIFDEEVDDLYYVVSLEGKELCRRDVSSATGYVNPYDRGHEVPCEKADIHIYFGDLFRDEGETSQAALELVNEYGSGWYLATRMCPGEYEITLCDNDDKTVWTLNPYVEYNEEGTYFSFTQGATSVIGEIDEDDDTFRAFSDVTGLYNNFSATGIEWNDNRKDASANIELKFTTDIAPEDLVYQLYYAGKSDAPFRGSVFDGYREPESVKNIDGTYTYTISYTATDFYGTSLYEKYGLPDGYIFIRLTSADGSILYAESMHAFGDAEHGYDQIIA